MKTEGDEHLKRRYERFEVPAGSLQKQSIKRKGILSVLGSSDCTVKDLSQAGALLTTKMSLSPGAGVVVTLEFVTGENIILEGEVANSSLDVAKDVTRLGIAFDPVTLTSSAGQFLASLNQRFGKTE